MCQEPIRQQAKERTHHNKHFHGEAIPWHLRFVMADSTI
jgi:hypothetical protein